MTEQSQYIIDADTKAKIQILVQGRTEDRETIHELAIDMKDMAKNVSDMAIAITGQTKDNQHLGQRVDRVEATQASQAKEIKELTNTQSGNKVRWQVLAAGITAFIAVGGLFLTLFLWLADKIIGSNSIP